MSPLQWIVFVWALPSLLWAVALLVAEVRDRLRRPEGRRLHLVADDERGTA